MKIPKKKTNPTQEAQDWLKYKDILEKQMESIRPKWAFWSWLEDEHPHAYNVIWFIITAMSVIALIISIIKITLL